MKGNEAILDLGCGDGILTEQLSLLVPDGYVLGIDASVGMIEKAEQNVHDNLKFRQCVPDETKKEFRDEVVEEMLSKALQPDGTCFETFRRINVRLVK